MVSSSGYEFQFGSVPMFASVYIYTLVVCTSANDVDVRVVPTVCFVLNVNYFAMQTLDYYYVQFQLFE